MQEIPARSGVLAAMVVVVLAFGMAPALATPGGVDANGCHTSKKQGHHCHPERARGSGGADGTQSARDKRLRRECKGRPNSGACLGYARP